MQEPQLTPAQAARRFADEHGFKIVAVGRRYQATHSTGVSFERGGYVALLNEMRAVIGCIENGNEHPVHGFAIDADTPVGVEMCAGGTLVLPEPSADPALNATANNCFGTLEPITPDTVPMSREEMFAPVKAELNRLYDGAQTLAIDNPANWAHKTADEIKADIVAGVAMLTQQSRDYNDLEYGTGATLDTVAKRMGRDERAAGMSDREYRNLLIYGDSRGMPGVDFNEFNAASKARIRRAARKLLGKPPGGPWHVIFNGATVMKYGYPSRAEAVAVVRWGFNHPDPIINNNWRTATVTVEYRA